MTITNQKQRGLGKGLSALMGIDTDIIQLAKTTGSTVANEDKNSVVLNIDDILPNENQPRKLFSQESLQELAESIKVNGVIQPIIVRKHQDKAEKFQIIAGERRWRASRIVGLSEIPAIIKDISDKETIGIALIENIQRQDLTILEEAEGYKKLISEFNYTQEDLSEIVGKSRSHIANLLRLLSLPIAIKDLVNSGNLTMGHARALIGVANSEEIAQKIVSNQLNVRDTEKLVKKLQNSNDNKTNIAKNNVLNTNITKDNDLVIIEKHVSEKLGMKVNIEDSKVIIYFDKLEQLDIIIKRLTGEF